MTPHHAGMRQTGVRAVLLFAICLLVQLTSTVGAQAVSTPPRLGADTWVDVDGDGLADHVTLSDLGAHTRVAVSTARGRISRVDVPFDDNQGGLPVTQRLLGAATVDGRPGLELVVFVAVGDCSHDQLLTWRHNTLVPLPAPRRLSWGVCFLGSAPFGEGYARRVRHHRAQLLHYTGVTSGKKVSVRRTLYVWRTSRWVKQSVATMRVTTPHSYKFWTLNFPWYTPAPMVGDINGDHVVDCADKSILLDDWGTAMPRSDLNHDHVVDIQDLSILIAHWTGTSTCTG